MTTHFPHIQLPVDLNKLILHCCCAPCASAIVEALWAQQVSMVLYFYNPNIHPREEYNLRKAELIRFSQEKGIEFADGDYDIASWHKAVEGYESEPERGLRCQRCFDLRLWHTASFAHEQGVAYFATTLASSRWKRLDQIEAAGKQAQAAFPGTVFWHQNWRKGGLQELRQQLIAEHQFYNQTFCGCLYSHRKEESSKEPDLK